MINQDYQFTEFCDVTRHKLEDYSVFFYEQDTEARSVYCSNELRKNNPTVRFIGIVENDEDKIELIENGVPMDTLLLHSAINIYTVIRNINPSCVYLDVTGMNCRVVAPFLKVLLEEEIAAKVVYAEPQDYLLSAFQKEGLNNNLSEMVDGVHPLPCFVNLFPYDEENPPELVTLLGFEGWRFSYIVNDQNTIDKKIRPIIGVPGYKMNYPYISLWGNRNMLVSHRCSNRIDYAEANSIVDIFFKLKHIFHKNHQSRMIVAPIGTKPHAIGAIVYAIKYPRQVEILYDNPKRTLHRTEGVGRVSICNVTRLYKL